MFRALIMFVAFSLLLTVPGGDVRAQAAVRSARAGAPTSLGPSGWGSRSQEPSPPPGQITIPIRFRVARLDGEPVRDEDWLAAQLVEANRIFAPSGVQFEALESQSLPQPDARIRSIHQRNQLARHLERAVVNVFVVGSMMDTDGHTPRRGVHWRVRWRPRQHYCVLTSIAPRTTLAHELGHYFGNRVHSTVPGNIMSYDQGRSPSFARFQLRKIVRATRRYLARRELYSVDRWRELVRNGYLAHPHSR